MAKALVAYFSVSGTTKRVAERLAKATGADLFRIEPETPYTSADLNWRDRHSRTTQEKNDRSIRPALKGTMPDVSGYDVVYVGFLGQDDRAVCNLGRKQCSSFYARPCAVCSGSSRRIRRAPEWRIGCSSCEACRAVCLKRTVWMHPLSP